MNSHQISEPSTVLQPEIWYFQVFVGYHQSSYYNRYFQVVFFQKYADLQPPTGHLGERQYAQLGPTTGDDDVTRLLGLDVAATPGDPGKQYGNEWSNIRLWSQ